ncbi:hypothetical protein VSQ32_06010 [Lachnospiraceae bacterium KK002]
MDESSEKKSFTAFLEKILRKKYGDGFAEDIPSNSDSIKNLKRDLKGKLGGLGYKDILKNELYLQGNKKIFPEYILAFFEVLLLLPSGKKNCLGSKIKNGRFDKITEDEIENFAGQMRESFQSYGKSIVVEGLDSNRKKELDDMIDEAEDLDEIENDWDNAVEEEYVYRRWELLSKANMYAEEVKAALENKKKIMLAEKRMGTMVQERIKELLDLPEVLNRKIDILVDYKSDIDGLKDNYFTLPSNHLTTVQEAEKSQRYYFSSGEKLFLLEQFELYLKTYLENWEKLLEDYKKEFETAEEEYFAEKREHLPNMFEIFTSVILNLYTKEKETNRDEKSLF